MAIKEGDFVKIEFVGKINETGNVFDTTSQEVAEETNIYDKNKKYGPLSIILGSGHLLPAIEKEITGLEVGDTKDLTLQPEDAFGQRDPNLIQLIPLKEFKKNNMNPYPGMVITSNGQAGRVLTVGSGRVKVDFNNYLAGKVLDYNITIVDTIEDETEKVKSMVDFHYSSNNMDLDKVEVEFDNDTIKIKLDELARFDQQRTVMDTTLINHKLSKDLYDNLPYEKVQFIDEFKKPEEKPEEETEEEE